MPLFRSTAAQSITFDAGEYRYTVPSGGVCEIDRRVAYVPRARGLPLEPTERGDVKDAKIIEGVPVPPPRVTRVRGVASGSTVLQSDDGDDRVGEPISEHRADLQSLSATPSDEDDDATAPVDPGLVAALASRRKK